MNIELRSFSWYIYAVMSAKPAGEKNAANSQGRPSYKISSRGQSAFATVVQTLASCAFETFVEAHPPEGSTA